MNDRRRPRRIASDEAHAWARNLRLANPMAKLVLCMLTLYVNGEGLCYVSVAQLADDCELAADTVRRRLAWLEEVGAIQRRAQWIDENGRRNSEGRGRRTSDDILLVIEADVDGIEKNATGSREQSDPLPERGVSEQGAESVSPAVSPPLTPAMQRGAESSEPEPEESPPSPPTGGTHNEGWEEFKRAWAEPMQRPSLAFQVWQELTPELRSRAAKAACGYFEWLKSQGKRAPATVSAQTFLRETGGWDRWEAHAPPPPPAPPRFVSEDSEEFRAMQVIDVVRGGIPRPALEIDGKGRGVMGPSWQRGADFMALAQFDPKDRTNWCDLDWKADKQAVASWNERIKAWYGVGELYRRNVPTGETLRVLDREYPRVRTLSSVPCKWPPRKDGTLCAIGPPSALMTPDDEAVNWR